MAPDEICQHRMVYDFQRLIFSVVLLSTCVETSYVVLTNSREVYKSMAKWAFHFVIIHHSSPFWTTAGVNLSYEFRKLPVISLNHFRRNLSDIIASLKLLHLHLQRFDEFYPYRLKNGWRFFHSNCLVETLRLNRRGMSNRRTFYSISSINGVLAFCVITHKYKQFRGSINSKLSCMADSAYCAYFKVVRKQKISLGFFILQF